MPLGRKTSSHFRSSFAGGRSVGRTSELYTHGHPASIIIDTNSKRGILGLMTPEEIVGKVEEDMKEGAAQYQPAYWKVKLTERIRAAIKLAVEQDKKETK